MALSELLLTFLVISFIISQVRYNMQINTNYCVYDRIFNKTIKINDNIEILNRLPQMRYCKINFRTQFSIIGDIQIHSLKLSFVHSQKTISVCSLPIRSQIFLSTFTFKFVLTVTFQSQFNTTGLFIEFCYTVLIQKISWLSLTQVTRHIRDK